jgi:hypothetical protein
MQKIAQAILYLLPKNKRRFLEVPETAKTVQLNGTTSFLQNNHLLLVIAIRHFPLIGLFGSRPLESPKRGFLTGD